MKSKYIYTAAVAVAAVFAPSCIDDSSTYGDGPVPTLSVAVPGNEEMPVYNFNYGDECVIDPQISYNGNGELSYKWSIGTYDNNVKGELKEVSASKVLSYHFEKGGNYYAQLEVSDGSVGLIQLYNISINRTFEKGFLLISNSLSGKGNLAFIKDRTREEIEAGIPPVIMENCLQRVNDNISDAPLVSATALSINIWTGSWATSYDIDRFVILGERNAFFIDPNTFTLSSSVDYNSVIPGFRCTKAIRNYQSPVAVDTDKKQYITFDLQNMFGYQDSGWKNYDFDLISCHIYKQWGSEYSDLYYIYTSPLELKAQVYDPSDFSLIWASTSDIYGSDGKPVLMDKELVTVFQGEQEGYVRPCYLITRDRNTGKYFTQGFTGFGNSYAIEVHCNSEMATSAASALPAADCVPIVSSTVHRVYYFTGSGVYTMIKDGNAFVLPDTSEFSISYSSDEEVTFINVVDDPDKAGSELLLVATADKTTGRGNLYMYDVNDVRTNNPNPTPKAQYLNCADRISSIIYKPRMTN